MKNLQEQVELIESKYPGTHLDECFGNIFVVVPDFQLPSFWNKKSTTVRFKVPVGFPFSPPPKHFWTDHDLRFSNNGWPAHTQINGDWFQFAWTPLYWNVNRDTLLTYVHLIKQRLWTHK